MSRSSPRSYTPQGSPQSRSSSPSMNIAGNYSDQNYQSYGYTFDYVPRKKRSRHGCREEKVDRISELPNSMILHILSFLEAEDVVGTGILSKRFTYLWRDVDRLSFQYSSLEFIRNTLFFHKLSNLKKFSVKFNYDYEDGYTNYAVEFDQWIRILCLENVEDLTLKFENCAYSLPQHFYSNSSINKLNLSCCKINRNPVVSWESLQSLSMSKAKLANNTIAEVVAGCPSLEILELSDCRGFTRISLIDTERLRKLVIRNYGEVSRRLKIDAPYLESFALSGCMRRCRCKVLNAKSLVDCCLDFSIESYSNKNKDKAIRMLTSLLEDVSYVKDVVTIGEWGLQVLSLIERAGLPFPMAKSTIKCLKLDTNLTAAVMGGIRCLLRGLNCLEKLLIIKLDYTCSYDDPLWFSSKDLIFHDGERSVLMTSDMETGSHLKLKTVEISGFPARPSWGMVEGEHQVDLLVMFFMGTASLLENVTIRNIAYGTDWDLLQLSKELLRCRRSSSRAEITILE